MCTPVNVNDEQRNVAGKTYNMPPPLSSVVHTVFDQQVIRIVEHLHGSFEVDAVLLLIGSILCRIPFEAHAVIHNV